jgi:hypothetical protein
MFQRGGATFYFPVVTCIIISIVVSAVSHGLLERRGTKTVATIFTTDLAGMVRPKHG